MRIQDHRRLVFAAAVASVAADDDPLGVFARHLEVSFALVVLLGGGVVHGPLVGLTHAGLGLLVVAGGLDPEDVLAHPLLHAREAVPAEADRAHPPPQILALVHDVARRRQRAASFQVLPGEVEAALPVDGPGRAPGGVDVVQLLAPFLRQCAGRGVNGQSFGSPMLVHCRSPS
ncbi:hypothetical protein [Streptomyces cinerochromogenes]|uniref:hypothetical protein n=1 Tax=Streptomyces cinerochromogenes TaxID=66422 RepID=UPI003F541AC1